MDKQLLAPFIEATTTVLSTMAQTEPIVGDVEEKSDDCADGDVSGIIGMASDGIAGNLIISFEESCVLSIVSKMLMEEFSEMNDEVVDAVGELTNMICGSAKAKLSEIGHSFDMATPVILRGKNIQLHQLSKNSMVSVPFATEGGTFWVQANLGSA